MITFTIQGLDGYFCRKQWLFPWAYRCLIGWLEQLGSICVVILWPSPFVLRTPSGRMTMTKTPEGKDKSCHLSSRVICVCSIVSLSPSPTSCPLSHFCSLELRGWSASRGSLLPWSGCRLPFTSLLLSHQLYQVAPNASLSQLYLDGWLLFTTQWSSVPLMLLPSHCLGSFPR